jgi:hypothetical protein
MVERFRVRLHAYVLMDNHYHLMAELTEANLSRLGQWLNGSYCLWFNRRHERSGHLFQGRFKSVVVDPMRWALELSRHVHLNPVRVARLGLGKGDRSHRRAGGGVAPERGQVEERLARLRGYRWSSYRAYVGLDRRAAWVECERVLELGGGPKWQRAARYREYVETAVREGLGASPWDGLREQVILGGEEFAQRLRRWIGGDAREQGGVKRLERSRPRLEEVIAAVEKVKGQRWEEFRDRYGDEGRDLVLHLGRGACGLKLGELAVAAGMKEYSAVSIALKRYGDRVQRSKSTRAMLKRACEMLNIEM